MYKHTNSRPSARPKILLIVGVLLVIILIGTGVFLWQKHSSNQKNETIIGKTSNGDYVNLSPPTAQDKQDVNQHKEDLPSTTNTPQAATKVTPVIVDASQYGQNIEVRSFIPEIYEDGGTCTFTFTHGNLTVTKTTPGTKDATTTRCTNLTVARNAFGTTGSWSVVVSYNSAKAQGQSTTKQFEVQ